MAEVSNTSLGESVIAMAKNFNLSFVETEPGIYSLTGIAYMYNKDGIFILTTNPKVIPNLQTGFSPSLAAYNCASFYQDNYGEMFINIKEIKKKHFFLVRRLVVLWRRPSQSAVTAEKGKVQPPHCWSVVTFRASYAFKEGDAIIIYYHPPLILW